MGAPAGNRNASKDNRLWKETIHRVVTQGGSKRLRAAAEKLVARAEEGDVRALIELGDRIDGKVPQSITAEVSADLTINIVRFADNAP